MELSAITEEPRVLLINGIPKWYCWKRFKNLITKHSHDGVLSLQLIPQDVLNIAEATCTANGYERLLNTTCLPLLKLSNCICIYPISACLTNDLVPNAEMTIFDLNYDCLRAIFSQCSTKDQISLAKVCRRFHETIRDIWSGKARTFVYNPYKLEFEENLSSEEIKEIFAIVGSYVETLRYNTVFYFPMLSRHLADTSGNMVTMAKKFVNMNLCRNLMYLENIEIFEVEGKFLADFTVRELARYCQIRVFRLLDTDSRYLKGQYMPMLPRLEELYLRDCQSFLSRNLSRTCKVSNIIRLDITECPCMRDPRKVQELCGLLPDLEVLKLSAQTNELVLTAILRLPKLKSLEFFWVADQSKSFEILLLQQLAMLRPDSLQSLKFVVDRFAIDNQSLQSPMNNVQNASLREMATATGLKWCLDDEFGDIVALLAKATDLENLIFEYCRPLSHENLSKLPNMCGQLKQLRLIGCPTKEDIVFREHWEDQQGHRKYSQEICKLEFETIMSVADVEQLKQSKPVRSVHHYSLTVRSIECRFR